MNPQDQVTAPASTSIPAPMPVKSQQLIGPVELVSSSWSFFKKNWKILISIIATLFVSGGVVFLLLAGSIIIKSVPLIIICSILYVVIILLCGLTLYSAVINAIHRLSTETSPVLSVIGQYKFGISLLWPFLLLMIITGLVTYGSFALLFIPGIIIGIYICMSLFSFVVDGKRGFSALIESYNLVNGHWWAVFGRMMFLVLVVIGAGLVFEIIVGFSTTALSFILPSVVFVAPLFVVIFEIVMISFAIIYMYKLYIALKSIQTADISTKNIKPWLIAFLTIGILVVVAYLFIVISIGITGFGSGFNQARQNAYRTQTNNPQLQSQIQQMMQQYSSTTIPAQK